MNERAVTTPKGIETVLNWYGNKGITEVVQPLNLKDFLDQKNKQNAYPIEGGALGVITTPQNEVVLVRRTKPHGGWALPGGRVEKGEEFDLAFTREALEECGVSVKVTDLVMVEHKIFTYEQEKLPFWLVVFKGHTLDTAYKTADAIAEGLEVATFPIDKLPEEMVLKDKEKILYALH